MTKTMTGSRGAIAVAVFLALPRPLAGQSIAERVAAVSDGTVHMSFAARPGVCGNGVNSISLGHGSRISWNGNSRSYNDEWSSDACEFGPVRVSLDVRDGDVTELRAYVGGEWRSGQGGRSSVTDIGLVPARAAADYLLTIAARVKGEAARDAIFPATLADSVVVWPKLLEIARDENRPRETRKSAVFWVGQAAGEAATAGLDSLVRFDEVEREIKEQAIFALSQRPEDEGVPALIRVVRTNPDPELKKKALFWLGQSGDERALALFEELLLSSQ
ncbi:MAG: HEAT repeat domain-containing protein [Gemmatimonadaceae bacterium]